MTRVLPLKCSQHYFSCVIELHFRMIVVVTENNLFHLINFEASARAKFFTNIGIMDSCYIPSEHITFIEIIFTAFVEVDPACAFFEKCDIRASRKITMPR